MAKVTKIYVDENTNVLRCDWDNDRHQAIEIKGDTPRDFIESLHKMVELLHIEKQNCEI